MRLTVVYDKKALDPRNQAAREKIAARFGFSPHYDINHRTLDSPCDIADGDLPLLRQCADLGWLKIYYTTTYK